ncbi:MAG: FAD-dependent oxidoreductase [Sodalis sp. (in: enterobacteria)]|uniref:FAD-dependent oxidoreductase n=1 Tax=Sodalis sp. (in: enterobacteria) TaxID=1898979 RepID=UPI003F3C185A
MSWQQLVLATGSRPVMPPLPRIDLLHVCGFRTLDDVKHMLAVDGPVVVLGGGGCWVSKRPPHCVAAVGR